MSPTVLVTGAGHTTAVSLMQALQCEPLTLLACDDNPRAAGLRMLPENQRFVVHSSGSPEFIGDLIGVCLREQVDLLVATDINDVPPLARSRDLFERLGTRVWLDPARRTTREMSGMTADQVASKCVPSRGAKIWGALTKLFA